MTKEGALSYSYKDFNPENIDMSSLFLLLVLAALGLLLILAARYILLRKRYARIPDPVLLPPGFSEPDINGFSQRFSRLIQIPTVSWTDRSKRDPDVFRRFQETLRQLYPQVHATLERTVISEFGLVYRWKGQDPGKKPVLFLAHYDVVPAEEKGDETWQVPPFSGEIRDGILWGRGTLDIKCMIAFYMETAEALIAQGFQPQCDIYFAFGGDEEIGGPEGAAIIASRFREQHLKFDFIMDEGGVITRDQMAFLKGKPAALVGLAEKGFVTFRIRATGESGHSSMPGGEGTAVSRLAKGITRLENRSFPSRLDPVLKDMLVRYVPFVSPGLGIIFANLWLFSPLIRLIFSKNRVTDSLIRTTQAVTVFKAGEQENILPGEAFCLVNHRILPGDTMAGILARHRQTLKDPSLTVSDAGNWPSNDPIPASREQRSGFELIRSVLAATHPQAVTTPFLVNGSTDSKYYADLTDQVLRFCPLVLPPADVGSIHGVNEKVSLENLEKGLAFYLRLFCHL